MSVNPFSPSFGQQPSSLISRPQSLNPTFLKDELEKPMSPYHTTFITGPRGSGKTIFLNDLRALLSNKQGWIICKLRMSGNLLEDLYLQLYCHPKLQKYVDKNKLSTLSISALGFEAGLGFQSAELPVEMRLDALLQKIKFEKILITMDEIVYSQGLAHLLSYYQDWLASDYPISFIGAGLPKLLTNVMESHGLTFLLRSQILMLEPFGVQAVAKAYYEAFEGRLRPDLATTLAQISKGYSYFYQLLGYHLWNCTSSESEIAYPDIQKAVDIAQVDLFNQSYDRIIDELSDTELAFIRGMYHQHSTHIKIADMIEFLGWDKNKVNQYRRRLIKQGLIESPERGIIQFVLPFFAQYFDYIYD